ncbi:MAG: protein kinase [Anaerolineae bacterium]|nr:protein kinase [Anaerolineae bacterium]
MSRLIQNRYEVEVSIGSGGMGTVYRCLDTQTGKKVALKELSPDAVKRDPALVERFLREGEALRALNHPSIVKVYDAFSEDGTYYLVMDYVAGGSLKDLLERNPPITMIRALEIALGVSDALTRAHHVNIVHRDIKPANILITLDGAALLTDFGVARIMSKDDMKDGITLDSLTQTGAAIGTPDYMPPEAINEGTSDFATDVWSFGVMLYEMLAHRRPFVSPGGMPGAILLAIVSQPIPDLRTFCPEAPEELVELVNHLLDKDYTRRPKSFRQIGGTIETILNTLREDAGQEHKPAADPTAPSTLDNPHNLPASSHSIEGRGEELAVIRRLMGELPTRLITIIGPVETGKTALALAAAWRERGRFPHGVWLAKLESCANLEAVVSTITQAVGCPSDGNASMQTLLEFLKRKTLLIVLDHCPPVPMLDRIVQQILDYCLSVRILATSREPLNLAGEIVLDPGYVKRSEANGIMATGLIAFRTKGTTLSEREYRFVQEQVDTGVLNPTEEMQEVLRISRRHSLQRHLIYRGFAVVFTSGLLILINPLAQLVQASSESDYTQASLLSVITTLFVGIIINGSSTLLLTYLEYKHKSYRKRLLWFMASMGLALGLLLMMLQSISVYKNPVVALVVGTITGVVVGGMLFATLPRERYPFWWQQITRSAIVGLIFGVIVTLLTTALMRVQPQEQPVDTHGLWFQIPLATTLFAVSFSVGIEASNRLLWGPPPSLTKKKLTTPVPGAE